MRKTSSFEQFDLYGVLDTYSSSKGSESEEGENLGKQTPFYGTEYWGDLRDISFSSNFGFNQESTFDEGPALSKYQQEQQLQLYSEFGFLEDLYFDILSPPVQPSQEEIAKLASLQTENAEPVDPERETPSVFPLASLGILRNYGSGFRRLNGERINLPSYDTTCTRVGGRKLSTEAIMRLAGEKFIQYASQRVDELSHPSGDSLFGLSDEETKDVVLVQYLLASAEKASQQQFDRATKLLNMCDEFSSKTGNPLQRVVYYFSKALREKIDREAGRITSKGLGKKQLLDIEDAMMSLNPAIFAIRQNLPFCQVGQFTGMQAIMENLGEAKKIHLIDLEIRNGVQCTILMQALAARSECPVELLKITAVGTKSKAKIEKTGKQLESFALNINLPFSFNIVMVSNMLDLNEGLFELEPEEMVAVYAEYFLMRMIAQPNHLDSLVRVIKNINPCIMVFSEVDANTNSPVFVNRFIETLFFYGAYFDCLGDCLDQNDPYRTITESVYFSVGIQNIVAAEGMERNIRHVKINVWRAFFAHYGIVETELSTSSLYQASLVMNNFNCGSSCTLDKDGKCLIIGWKGTPIFSLSTWKIL